MSYLEQIAALKNEAAVIIKDGGEALSQEKYDEAMAKIAKAEELKGLVERGSKASAALESLAGDEVEVHGVGREGVSGKGVLTNFLESKSFKGLQERFPAGISDGTSVSVERTNVGSLKSLMAHRYGQKAPLTAAIAQPTPQELPLVDLVERPALSILDLVSRGSMSGDSIRYVQITNVDRNAAIVPEATGTTGDTLAAGVKPESEFETSIETAEAVTYADGYTVTNKLLSDSPAFATFMDGELRYSLPALIEDTILNGSGINGEPRGILNTTGVQQVDYTGTDTKAMVVAIRKGITAVTRLRGGTVQAVVINPEDEERLDLFEDADGRFYGQGPFGTGPATIWGRPRVLSEAVPAGTFLLGDFRQVALLDREGLSIEAFNQHADYAKRNLVYVRAELRAAQAIWRPSRLVVVSKAV